MRLRPWLTGAAMLLPACGPPSGATNTGTKTASALSMPVPRAAHSAAALPDGRVLLIGGCVAESCEAGPDSSTVDAFDPRTGNFSRAGSLLQPRVGTTAVPLGDGRVFIAGGWSGSQVTPATETFSAADGRSRAGPQLSTPRADMAAVTLKDGRILLAGGYDGRGALSVIEVYDPRTNQLRRIGSLTLARTGAGAALLPDGRVLVVGGGINSGDSLRATATAEIVDAATGRSAATGSLADARYKHAVVALPDGKILVLGGSDERDSNGTLDSVEAFDAAAGLFRPAGRLTSRRYKIANSIVALRDGRLLITGGAPRAEIYDPAAMTSVEAGPSFGGSLNFSTASQTSDGSVLVAGGYYEDGIRMSRGAWLLRPAQLR